MHRKCKNTKNTKNYTSHHENNFFVRKMKACCVFYDRIAKNRSRDNQKRIEMIRHFGKRVNAKWSKIESTHGKKVAQKIKRYRENKNLFCDQEANSGVFPRILCQSGLNFLDF